MLQRYCQQQAESYAYALPLLFPLCQQHLNWGYRESLYTEALYYPEWRFQNCLYRRGQQR